MSKKIERELNKSLLEKRLLSMSQKERDNYFDKAITEKQGKELNPIRKIFEAQGYNKDGVYLGNIPSDDSIRSMSANLRKVGHPTSTKEKKNI